MATTSSSVTSPTQAGIRRHVLIRQVAIFGVIVGAICTMNVFTTIADHARDGVPVQWWEPVLWEYSSGAMIWLLIPGVAWLYRRAPITAQTWRWAVPLHLAVTPLFSLVHVDGMVLLREIGYALLHEHYRFGPWVADWIYEYRKDVVTYGLILAGLQAFRIYRLWLESHRTPPPALPAAEAGTSESAPLHRLVVKKLNREFILHTTDIDRIDADGNYVIIHAQGTTWPLRESMTVFERKLDPKCFVRVTAATSSTSIASAKSSPGTAATTASS